MGVFLDRGLPLAKVARRCRFESLESRQMLAGDSVTVGVDALSAPSAASDFGQTGSITGAISGNVFVASTAEACTIHAKTDHSETDVAPNGLPGVLVQLVSPAGIVLEEQVTDELGAYEFEALLPGEYIVHQQTPAGFVDSSATVGAGGEIVFGTNQVDQIMVQANETLDGFDFCNLAVVPEVTEITEAGMPEVGNEIIGPNAFILGLSLQPHAVQTANVNVESTTSLPVRVTSAPLATPVSLPSTSDFRNSLLKFPRQQAEPENDSPLLEEDLLDGFFSSPDDFELTAAELLGPWLKEEYGDYQQDDSVLDEAYTSQSTELWKDDGLIELELSFDEEEIVEVAQKPIEQAAAPTDSDTSKRK